MDEKVLRGDIWIADLGDMPGSEQSGTRPVLIIQNDMGNKFSPTVIVAAITSKCKKPLPVNVEIDRGIRCGLAVDSTILANQIRTLDKSCLKERIGLADGDIMRDVDEALRISIGLEEQT